MNTDLANLDIEVDKNGYASTNITVNGSDDEKVNLQLLKHETLVKVEKNSS